MQCSPLFHHVKTYQIPTYETYVLTKWYFPISETIKEAQAVFVNFFLVKVHFNLKNLFMLTAVIQVLKLHGKFKFFNDSYFVVTEEEIYSESSFDTYLQATILAMHKRVALYYVVIAQCQRKRGNFLYQQRRGSPNKFCYLDLIHQFELIIKVLSSSMLISSCRSSNGFRSLIK